MGVGAYVSTMGLDLCDPSLFGAVVDTQDGPGSSSWGPGMGSWTSGFEQLCGAKAKPGRPGRRGEQGKWAEETSGEDQSQGGAPLPTPPCV